MAYWNGTIITMKKEVFDDYTIPKTDAIAALEMILANDMFIKAPRMSRLLGFLSKNQSPALLETQMNMPFASRSLIEMHLLIIPVKILLSGFRSAACAQNLKRITRPGEWILILKYQFQ